MVERVWGWSVATAQEPQRVSAADFIRGFANWRLQSARKPVVVTHHGKDAHVLISLDDYRRLDGKIARDVAAASDLLQASLAGLVESVRDGVILIDRSEERRVGEEWVSTCRSRWSQAH